MSCRLMTQVSSMVVVGALAASLAGCSVEISSLAPAEARQVTPGRVQGKVMGGETPIENAVVTLYETQNNGYGGVGKPLGTTTTQVGGGFTFTNAAACDSGQYVYITSVGGDTANNPAAPQINNNVVLMAALGSCANFGTPSNVNIMINELTTVAAGYALNGFISETGSLGSQVVNISAPANNNAATGACTGTGSAMTCTAAGLGHAFANALNLVDAVHYDGSAPSGTAFTTIPANPPGAVTTQAANTMASVPAALINTLGNIMQYCTNSTGGVSGDGSACGYFFLDATPSGSVAPAPTDTLAAIINVAQNPKTNIGTTCTGQSGGLFCLAPGAGAPFQPQLTAAPHDWAVMIVYTGASNLTSNAAFNVPYYLALDANDDVFVMTGTGTNTNEGIAEMTSSGQGLWAITPNAAYCNPGQIMTDANGFVWLTIATNTSSTPDSCAFAIYGFYSSANASTYNSTAGTVAYSFGPGSGTVCDQTTPTSANCPGFTSYDTVHSIQSDAQGITFDRLGNLWYARHSSSCTQCLFELPFTPGSGSTPGTFGSPINTQNAIVDANQLLIDTNYNVWIGNIVTSGDGVLYLLPNQTPTSSPTYTATPGYLSATLPATSDGGIALDNYGDVWAGSNLNATEFTPTKTAGVYSAWGTGTSLTTSASKPYPGVMDGNSNYWYPSFTTSGQIWFQYTPHSTQYSSGTASHNDNEIIPCWLPSGASTCSSTIVTANPKVLQVDSTGAIWVAAQTGTTSPIAGGYLVQILGAAAPTWPLLANGEFGQKPQ